MKIKYSDNVSNSNSNFNLRSIIKNGVVSTQEDDFIDEAIDEIVINNPSKERFLEEIDKNISMDILNRLNIIINDNDTSDNFFEEVVNKLSEYGLHFTSTKNGDNINVDTSIVITWDQQYTSASESVVFAPYDNTRIGNSDSLTLSIKAALENNDLNVGNILCGKTGYREEENGNIITCLPTHTEEIIDKNKETSFVTISLGTQNISADLIAKSIIEGLKRYIYYLNNFDFGSDLIYRASSNDSIEMVSEYFGTSDFDLKTFNNIGDQEILDSQAIINPSIKDLYVFNTKPNNSVDSNSILK